ncbi:MAG: hypothetical protein HY319_05225 [Armatimonadetes bacterium]|nr:hypothetical protein [Armatimonadota bacterium]
MNFSTILRLAGLCLTAAAWFGRHRDRAVAHRMASSADAARQLMREGHGAFRRGDLKRAAACYGAADRLVRMGNPDDPQLRMLPLYYAHVMFEKGDFRQAARLVRSALDRLPELPRLRFRRQSFYDRAGDYETRFAQLVGEALATRDAELLFLLGYECFFNGRADEARKYFEAAIEGRPSDFRAGRFLQALGG